MSKPRKNEVGVRMADVWSWSIRHSPLAYLYRWSRGLGRPNRDAYALLDRAGLPERLDGVIRVTIARTKLWRDERAQIARELVAHAQDALDAGRTPEHIAETFGDPHAVARLLRRSTKRKRPLAWRAYRMSRRAVGVMFLVLLLGYGWLAVRFYTGQPEIRIDYASQLAERNEGYSEDQKSWPVIAEVGFEWDKLAHTLREQQQERWSSDDQDAPRAGITLIPAIEPEHPDYAAIAEAVRSFAPHLARVREAAALPVAGVPLGYEEVEVEWEGKAFTRGIVPAEEDAYLVQPVVGIMLPGLAPSRSLARALVFDARLVLGEGDAGRAIDDYIAAMHLARQCNNEPFLISRLVGMGIHQLCIEEIERMVREHPKELTHDDLARLAHTHAVLTRQTGLGLESERLAFPDFLQRMYSDDGSGGGRLTAEGLAWMHQLYGAPEDLADPGADDTGIARRARAAAMPLTRITSNDRATERALHEDFMDRLQTVLDMGPRWSPILGALDLDVERERERAANTPYRYSMVSVMMPALAQSVNRYHHHRQVEGAFSVMLALESHRAAFGELPESIEALTPRFLPDIPEDLMDPGGQIKYRRAGDAYVLYSVGSDGNDDGARPPAEAQEGYARDPAQQFSMRFTQARDPRSGEPRYEPSGMPVLDDPQGPDGDWILIDTRPQADQTASD